MPWSVRVGTHVVEADGWYDRKSRRQHTSANDQTGPSAWLRICRAKAEGPESRSSEEDAWEYNRKPSFWLRQAIKLLSRSRFDQNVSGEESKSSPEDDANETSEID